MGKGLNILRWFNGYSSLLLSVCLVITYRCNLACKFCYQGEERKDTFPDMSIKDAMLIEKNITGAFTFMPRIHLFGGEPTFNKDFLEILRFFSSKNYIISMTSNGVDMNKYVEEFTAIRNLTELNISLNTMNYEEILSTLRLFKKHRHKNKIYITIACPINYVNQNEMFNIVREFENSYAKCIVFQHLTFTDYHNEMNFAGILMNVKKIKNTKFKIPVLFLPDIKPNDIKSYYTDPSFPYNRNKCVAPWIVPVIHPNCNVVPCDGIDITMGNIKEESLKKIWNNEKYRIFRNNIQKFGISHPICNRCCHRQYY